MKKCSVINCTHEVPDDREMCNNCFVKLKSLLEKREQEQFEQLIEEWTKEHPDGFTIMQMAADLIDSGKYKTSKHNTFATLCTRIKSYLKNKKIIDPQGRKVSQYCEYIPDEPIH